MTQDASAGNPRTETTVSLVVWTASVTYDEIVNSTGDAPSAMWKKGENVQGSLITRKEDGWKINSKLSTNRPLSDHINELLGRVYPKLCFLKQKGVGKIVLSATVYIYGFDRPPLQVDAEALRKLAELGASLDIDLYTFQ